MIRMCQINKSYNRPVEGRVQVLDGVDFEVRKGEFVSIVGPSGSGKTTLLNIIGLLDRPDNGEYRLLDQPVTGISQRERAQIRNSTIGFVFQQFHLLPRTTAVENVELPLVYAESTEPTEEKAIEALRRVGLDDRLTHYPSELSGGQQQRVAIARALVNDPAIILADEPTGNLDRNTGLEIMDLFQDLNRLGTTILLITHDAEIARRADRIVRIEEGRIGASPRESAS